MERSPLALLAVWSAIGLFAVPPAPARGASENAAAEAEAASAVQPPRSSPRPAVPLTEASLSAADSERLAKGEILVESSAVRGTSFKEGVGRALIPQPFERVVRAVADVLHYEEFMPFLEFSTAEPQKDGSILSRQRLELPRLLGTRHLTARYRLARPGPTTYRVTWLSVPGGEVRDQHGSFDLEPLGAGTLVTCRFFLDPGGAPAFLVNPQTERSVGWILDGLRQQVNRGRYAGP